MAKVFTQEEREKIKGQVVELVRQSGRETLRQLEAKTGATRYLMSVLARELVASGDVYNSGYGLFPSEQARKDWQNARKKLSRAKLKKTSAVDLDLIWSLPDGEIHRYDRRLNIICRECRKIRLIFFMSHRKDHIAITLLSGLTKKSARSAVKSAVQLWSHLTGCSLWRKEKPDWQMM